MASVQIAGTVVGFSWEKVLETVSAFMFGSNSTFDMKLELLKA